MYPLPIGKTDDPFDSGRVLTIPPAARQKHIAIFGESGVGKSTLLRNMIAWDIEHDAGVAVEDPRSNKVFTKTLQPHRRSDRIIVLLSSLSSRLRRG
jgi:ABC-type phosphate/phosphonate transport system ATPase subunit